MGWTRACPVCILLAAAGSSGVFITSGADKMSRQFVLVVECQLMGAGIDYLVGCYLFGLLKCSKLGFKWFKIKVHLNLILILMMGRNSFFNEPDLRQCAKQRWVHNQLRRFWRSFSRNSSISLFLFCMQWSPSSASETLPLACFQLFSAILASNSFLPAFIETGFCRNEIYGVEEFQIRFMPRDLV